MYIIYKEKRKRNPLCATAICRKQLLLLVLYFRYMCFCFINNSNLVDLIQRLIQLVKVTSRLFYCILFNFYDCEKRDWTEIGHAL